MRVHQIIKFLSIYFALTAFGFAERIYLSGTGPENAIDWNFKVSEGRNSGEWHTIPVPSNWEQHGFGSYNYGHDAPDEKSAEVGLYRTTFTIPKKYEKNHHIRIVFEGSMTETAVRVDGKLLGEPNQGGYVPFRYLLTHAGAGNKGYIKFGEEQTLEVEVSKKPSNESLDYAERKADYWVFGGIYRPVYIEILPLEFIDRVAIDGQANGELKVDVITQMHNAYKRGVPKSFIDECRVQLETLEGKPVGDPLSKTVELNAYAIPFAHKYEGIQPWSTEFPNLYNLRVSLLREGDVVHEKVERFGFRTFEVRSDEGLFLNGKRFMVRGMNRNSFHPDTGRALTREKIWSDAQEIKNMNVNLVRAHMSATKEFLDACDELGILYISEFTQWHTPSIDTLIARNIVFEIVSYYHNHPSVILWANGNEGGYNMEVDQLFYLLDLQKRPVIHPWANFAQINTHHYPSFSAVKRYLEEGGKVFLATEAIHGLYDGGHGAGLEETWDIMSKHSNAGGLVLWTWADAAIKRTDKDGVLDTAGNFSADGIVGPYGEKEASYYTAREIWSPVEIPVDALPENFAGELPVKNHFDETDLAQCTFEWTVLDFDDPARFGAKQKTAQKGVATLAEDSVPPSTKGTLRIPASALDKGEFLVVRVLDPHGRERMLWQWILRDESSFESKGNWRLAKGATWTVSDGDATWEFDSKTGKLLSLIHKGKDTSFKEGPTFFYQQNEKDDATAWPSLRWKASLAENAGLITIKSQSSDGSWYRWDFKNGEPAVFSYDFQPLNVGVLYSAVGFDIDREQVAAKRWLGDGPYPIWGNRLKGPQIGIWENDYNEGAAGYQWVFPEFSGIFGNVNWMRLKLSNGSILSVVTENPRHLGVLQPIEPGKPKKEAPPYPETGNLYFFHHTPAVGTKFMPASSIAPSGGYKQSNQPLKGRVAFYLD